MPTSSAEPLEEAFCAEAIFQYSAVDTLAEWLSFQMPVPVTAPVTACESLFLIEFQNGSPELSMTVIAQIKTQCIS